MEINRDREGQVFVMAAVLFSSLAILLFVTTADISPNQSQDSVKEFYENAFSGAPETLNYALENNYSIDNSLKEVYSYSRFVDRSSTSKGIDFGASYLILLPQRGESVFINYRDSSEEINLYNSKTGWINTSVSSNQYLEEQFSPGKNDFRIIIPSQDIDRSFTAANPRMFTLMKMSSQNQIWINSELS